MKTAIACALCLGAGLLGGAWSARGDIRTLRGDAERLRRDLDRAHRTKTAADLALVARLAQTEQKCAAPAPEPELPKVARPDAPPPPPARPDRVDPERGPFNQAVDRKQALEDLAAELSLAPAQREEVQQIGVDFQRSLEEAIGDLTTRFAFIEAGQTPRPREVVEASDRLLHTYLAADDRFRALLSPDQLDTLEDSDFDLIRLLDFEALGRLTDRARQGQGVNVHVTTGK
jgi:hypothetical protein